MPPEAVTHPVPVTAFLCGEGAKRESFFYTKFFYKKSQQLNSDLRRR